MSADLVPVTNPEQIAALPPKERGEMITAALHESKTWLAVATRGTDPTPVAEFKAWAATVAEMTRQKSLAHDIQLDAQEMVRRAERGIGLTIRNGQESGDIAQGGEGAGRPSSKSVHDENRLKRSPTDYLRRGNEMTQTYDLTDDVTDEQFDAALTDAREEGNVSRANVIRKVQSRSSANEAANVTPLRPAPAMIPTKQRRRGPGKGGVEAKHRVVRVGALHHISEQLAALGDLLDVADELDPEITAAEAAQWVSDLRVKNRRIKQLIKLLEDRTS